MELEYHNRLFLVEKIYQFLMAAKKQMKLYETVNEILI